MARKLKAATQKPASSKTSPKNKTTTSDTSASLKRKVDWATIDKNGEFEGFRIEAVRPKTMKQPPKTSNKKQKTNASGASANYKDAPLGADLVQENPFTETELSEVHCKVEPALEWESTNRYRKFTISGDEFEVGQYVFVKKSDEDHDAPNAIQHWLAKVLEVRAGDPSHVYLRVYWAYRPEDLPEGRQPHHGACELIVSNHMDIVEALCVHEAVNIVHWDDSPDKSSWPAHDELYWRQSLDINKPKGKQITKLNTYCIDKKPCNPDEALIQCSACLGWLHAHCIEQEAIKVAQTAKKSVGKKVAKAVPGAYSAQLDVPDASKKRLTVTQKRKGQQDRHWNVDITCLLCKTVIEKAPKSTMKSLTSKTPLSPTRDADEEKKTAPTTTVTNNPKPSRKRPRSDDSDITIKHDPSNDTTAPEPDAAIKAPAPRGRGRPKGAFKKRKRASTDTGVSAEDIFDIGPVPTVRDITPPPALVSESVFQSGVRSVKKLLWRAAG